MNGRAFRRLELFFAAPLFLAACAAGPRVDDAPADDGRYDTAFPRHEAADELDAILASVRMINCVAYYRHYVLPDTLHVDRSSLGDLLDRREDFPVEYFTQTASGTATLFGYEDGAFTFLTSAHVVSFPDTLVFYRDERDAAGEPHVRSVAVKQEQSNYIPDLPGVNDLRVLALDASTDVALVGQRLVLAPAEAPSVFRFPAGNSDDLTWGSFVYVLGFPAGAKMISSGLVSKSFRDRRHTFLIDTPFNRGFSGGLVLGVRDGLPHLELVGLALSSAATREVTVSPSRDDLPVEADPRLPYEGSLYVLERHPIRYGITICVSVNVVRDFVREHAERLKRQGYPLGVFE